MWKKIRNKKMIEILEKERVKRATLIWHFNPMVDGKEYVFKKVSVEELIKKLQNRDTECYQEEFNTYHIIDKWVNNFDYEVVLDVSQGESEK